MQAVVQRPDAPPGTWSFLTNHALVLIHVGRKPESTGLELAMAIGITERATRRILVDLQDAGYIERDKIGRRNRYRVDAHRPLLLIGDGALTAGQLLEFTLAPHRSSRPV